MLASRVRYCVLSSQVSQWQWGLHLWKGVRRHLEIDAPHLREAGDLGPETKARELSEGGRSGLES